MDKEQLKIRARAIVAYLADSNPEDLGFSDYLDAYNKIIELAEEYKKTNEIKEQIIKDPIF